MNTTLDIVHMLWAMGGYQPHGAFETSPPLTSDDGQIGGDATFAPFARPKTVIVDVTNNGVTESVETVWFTVSTIERGSAGN